MRRPIPQRERGAALLAVLILVAITGAIAAASLEKLRLSRMVAANVVALDQARHSAIGAEQLGMLIVNDLVVQDRTKTTLAGDWNGGVRRVPMPGGGAVEARLRDGGNCFNVNSVVQGEPDNLVRRGSGVDQFVALMMLRGVPEPDARRIAEAAADWADTDTIAGPGGAEDSAYASGPQPFRTANTLFADVSELRVLPAMRPEHFARVRPWLCALPVAELSPINVNTLLPGQALLLSALVQGRLSEEAARRVLAMRPAAGWNNAVEFWRTGMLRGLPIPLDVQQQPQVRTDWFVIDVRSNLGESEFFETALVDARFQPVRLAQRRWAREGDEMMTRGAN
ncbi:type II secretion system minor pseudopilin GspK [Sphingosinicella sp. YJ22]|uniref:type II secretion system minor pseudopilin GspK n=1 Tax=Sphingosinicella sp. YJ22 TaxID=1104780 RepID=UPI00140CD045|nr:type II secretion system minor pseudopilin GspK [Sphingosinicella sp. YJ22]